MNKLYCSTWFKVPAVILFIVSAVLLPFSVNIIGLYYINDMQKIPREEFLNLACENALDNIFLQKVLPAAVVITEYDNNSYEYAETIENMDLVEYRTNIRFTITDKDGSTVFSDFDADEGYILKNYVCTQDFLDRNHGIRRTEDGKRLPYKIEGMTITVYLLEDMKADDIFYKLPGIIDFFYSGLKTTAVIMFSCAAVMIVSLIYLIAVSGRKTNREGIEANFIDKIPFDIFLAALAAGIIVLLIFGSELSNQYMWYRQFWRKVCFFAEDDEILSAVLGDLCFSAVLILAFWLILSFSTRVKLRTLFKNTLIYRIIKIAGKACHKLKNFISRALRGLPSNAAIIGCTCGLMLFELILVFIIKIVRNEFFIILLAVFALIAVKILEICAVLLVCENKNRIETGIKRIHDGDINYKIQTDRMFTHLKYDADMTNDLGAGLNSAVDEKTRSERMKTELITNVSHDIKTPLTSIINYAGLIKAKKTEDEELNGYIDVLDRQSVKLKKLIEDLIEASKASTGNIQPEFTDTAIGVMLVQALGEYTERFEQKHLEPIVSEVDENIIISADGRLLWRIFDNLLGNTVKYSLEGTRVYLDMSSDGENVLITIKNISAQPLNISSDELTERFVRGDKSRSTEGSGLGLSIAKSLAELMNGTFNIIVDGDLFKAELIFRIKN